MHTGLQASQIEIFILLCYHATILIRGEVVCVKRCIVLSGVVSQT